MKKTTFYFLAILIMLCGVSASCDKTQPTSEKRVKTMIQCDSSGTIIDYSFEFTYDEQGRIVSVVGDEGEYLSTITYGVETITCKTLSSYSKSTETGYLNEQGQIIKIPYANSTHLYWYNISGSIDSTKINRLSPEEKLRTYNNSYEWYNGDLVHHNHKGDGYESITYYTYTTTENKANVVTYYWVLQNSPLYFCAPLMKAYQTKHLIKTEVQTNGKSTIHSSNFKYTFDADGYVTSLYDGYDLYVFRYE